jgi:hypothetical protein
MRLYDRAADHSLFFRSGWQANTTPAIPASGTVIDVEARAAIVQIVAALREIGIFSPSGA